MLLSTQEMTDLLEVKLISFFDTTNSKRGFNISKGGDGPLGVKWTEEHKKLQSERMSGSGNSMYGKHHSAKTRALISRKLTGKKLSEEVRARKTSYLLEASERRKKPINQYDLDGILVATYSGITDVEKEKGYNHSTIVRVCNGDYDTAYGFRWSYVDESLKKDAEEKRSNRSTNSMAVIQYDLDNNEVARYSSLVEAAKETGLCRDRIGDCCHGGLTSYGGSLWKFACEKPRETEKTAVIQCDKAGNEIARFSSLAEASSKTGTPRYRIRCCCNGSKASANGFVWKYADESQIKKTGVKVGVVQLDLSGNELARYTSLAEASKATGYDRHRIVECCKGSRQSFRDYTWRYATEQE